MYGPAVWRRVHRSDKRNGFGSGGDSLHDFRQHTHSQRGGTTGAPAMDAIAATQSMAISAAQSVTISDTTAGATVYYTTDGTTPTASSSVYTGAISVNSATTVQAMATAASHTASSVANANYKFRTPAGAYTLTVIPTVTVAGSSKSWQLNAISLTLVVN